MASQSSKRPSEEPHYTRGPAKRLSLAASESLLSLPAPANAPSMTPPSTPPASSSDSPATNISSPTISINRPASPVCPVTPKTPLKAADDSVLLTKDIFEMNKEELYAYMKLVGWNSLSLDPAWKSIPYGDDEYPDLEYEDAMYQQGLSGPPSDS